MNKINSSVTDVGFWQTLSWISFDISAIALMRGNSSARTVGRLWLECQDLRTTLGITKHPSVKYVRWWCDPRIWKKNLKQHDIADQTIYKCPNCNYSSKTNLARHMKSCQKEKTKVFHQCPLCPYKSGTKYLVTRHIRRHHCQDVV